MRLNALECLPIGGAGFVSYSFPHSRLFLTRPKFVPARLEAPDSSPIRFEFSQEPVLSLPKGPVLNRRGWPSAGLAGSSLGRRNPDIAQLFNSGLAAFPFRKVAACKSKLLPEPLRAQQGHEAAAPQGADGDSLAGLQHQQQLLLLAGSDGQGHPPAHAQLCQQ